MDKLMRELRRTGQNKISIEDTANALPKDKQFMEEQLGQCKNKLMTILKEIKEPLKALNELKKVVEGYNIEATSLLSDSKQLSIFDLKL